MRLLLHRQDGRRYRLPVSLLATSVLWWLVFGLLPPETALGGTEIEVRCSAPGSVGGLLLENEYPTPDLLQSRLGVGGPVLLDLQMAAGSIEGFRCWSLGTVPAAIPAPPSTPAILIDLGAGEVRVSAGQLEARVRIREGLGPAHSPVPPGQGAPVSVSLEGFLVDGERVDLAPRALDDETYHPSLTLRHEADAALAVFHREGYAVWHSQLIRELAENPNFLGLLEAPEVTQALLAELPPNRAELFSAAWTAAFGIRPEGAGAAAVVIAVSSDSTADLVLSNEAVGSASIRAQDLALVCLQASCELTIQEGGN